MSDSSMLGDFALGSSMLGGDIDAVVAPPTGLSGTVHAGTAVTGQPRVKAALSGAVVATTTVTADLRRKQPVAGTITGTATVTGDVTRTTLSGGHIVGRTVVTSNLHLAVEGLNGVLTLGTVVVARPRLALTLSTGFITGQATVVADLIKPKSLGTGTVAGSTVVTGNMIFHILRGRVTCGTTVTGYITLKGLSGGIIHGLTTITPPAGGFKVAALFGSATVAGRTTVHGLLHIYPQDFQNVTIHTSTRVNGTMLIGRNLGVVNIFGRTNVTASATWTGLLHPTAIHGHTAVRAQARHGFGADIIGTTMWWGTLGVKYRTTGQNIAGRTTVIATVLIDRIGGQIMGRTRFSTPLELNLNNGLFGVSAGYTKLHTFWSSAFVWFALGLIEQDRSGRNPPLIGPDGSVSLIVLPKGDLGLAEVLYCGTAFVGDLTVDRPRMIIFTGTAGASAPASTTVTCTVVGGTETRSTGTAGNYSPVTQMPVAYG